MKEGEIFSSIPPRIKMNIFYSLLQILSVVISFVQRPTTSHAAKIVDSLPGYPGNLPFRLQTGYIGVGEEEQIQLFYYFIESERDPKTDPLLLWLTGGPGCSSVSALLLETGPLNFIISPESWQSEIPYLELNPYSWTKVSNMIYVDSPVGTGFSYATTTEDYYSDDITSSRHVYEFLQKWLQEHVEFQNNPLYVTGDSYSGITIPIVVQEILNGNKDTTKPRINLKGYTLGNPVTVEKDTLGARYKYAHRVSLLSDELYEATKANCYGNYDPLDARNTKCYKNLQSVSRALEQLNEDQILEIKCDPTKSIDPQLCRLRGYHFFYVWANNRKVQEALHIREGTIINWARCNSTQEFNRAYRTNVDSSIGYHLNFTKESLHVLIYSGDQDMYVSYVDTLAWIAKLNVLIIDRWRPWFVKGQVSGYTTMHTNGHYHLTFATIKGAGHTAPEYKREECQLLFSKWLTAHSLE